MEWVNSKVDRNNREGNELAQVEDDGRAAVKPMEAERACLELVRSYERVSQEGGDD
jgi:hypothetical protein